ncbi:diguanylate cyclase [Eubacterium ramulus]|uniref:diguanylate cyclase n=1 Tax=Eubacterium ramulus TaxID=39490 RepID=UPI0026EC7009|nr:diguanylate cyclase [Eubacterium ramulus]
MIKGMSMTWEQAQAEIDLFRKIFEEVRLLSAEEVGSNEAIESEEEKLTQMCQCKSCSEQARSEHGCIAAKVLAGKTQKTKLEYIGSDLYEIVARYVEIDGKPYVMEMAHQVEEELIIEREGIDLSGNVKDSLFDKLYIDALSGAYNRRYFEDCVRNKVVNAGIAMLDLDDFKVSNDTYGHDLGDRLLHLVSYTIMGLIRKTDALIRYGGDEFLLVMPNVSEEDFEKKLEEIQYQIHMIQIPDSRGVFLSVSIGAVIARKQTVEKAMSRADKVMYIAKKQKNSIVTEWDRDRHPADWKKHYSDSTKQKILIVDDSEMNRAILYEMLHDDFEILEAESGELCIDMMKQYGRDISLLLLDIVMPGMDGFAVLEQMNHQKWIEDTPVIMISSENSAAYIRKAYDMGVSDFINRPFDANVVIRRVYNTIKLYAKQRRLTTILTEQIKAKEQSRKIMVAILSHIVEFRNGESGLHVQHINVLVKMLLERLRQVTDKYHISWLEQDIIVMASSLHDIGKIGIDDKILNKRGKLTAEEFEIMKTHTLIGASILEDLEWYQEEPLVKMAYSICRWHHERYDGKGYPDGLKGEEIPIAAQVVSLADVYDALVSKRVYKEGYSHEKTIEMILNGECGNFNPILIECLKDIQSDIPDEVYRGGVKSC